MKTIQPRWKEAERLRRLARTGDDSFVIGQRDTGARELEYIVTYYTEQEAQVTRVTYGLWKELWNLQHPNNPIL